MNYIGEIKLFAGVFNPPGFIDCDGSEYPIPLYRELFSILGYSYTNTGSSGSPKYFNVPTMKGLAPGTKYIICVDGYFPRDQFLQIYEGTTGDLVRNGKINDRYRDPKGKKLTRYDQATWQNYNLDTDEFEDSREE
jgi:hypothetical protein